MKGWPLLIGLALPLAGLAAGIAVNEVALASAETWVIPVAGYDPRDLLRGHYVDFRYLWTIEGDPERCARRDCRVCLERRGGTVVARIEPRGTRAQCPSAVDLAASDISPAFTNRIFVSESSAPGLEAGLRRGSLDLVALLTTDGRLISQRLQPRP